MRLTYFEAAIALQSHRVGKRRFAYAYPSEASAGCHARPVAAAWKVILKVYSRQGAAVSGCGEVRSGPNDVKGMRAFHVAAVAHVGFMSWLPRHARCCRRYRHWHSPIAL